VKAGSVFAVLQKTFSFKQHDKEFTNRST